MNRDEQATPCFNMKAHRIVSLLIFLLALSGPVSGQAAAPPFKVLFIGNSYTSVNDLPSLIVSLAEAAGGRRIEADQHLVGGCTLERHAKDGKAVEKIQAKRWDVVVLQEQSLRPVVERDLMHQYARVLDEEIKRQGAKTVFYLTWARQDIPKMQDGADPATSPEYARTMYQINGKAKTVDFQSWCKQERSGLTGGLSGVCFGIAKDLNAEVAPVGVAWKKALAADPKLVLHQADKSHPNPKGSYMAACVFYATLLGKSPVGLPGEVRKGGRAIVQISPDEVKVFQEIVWQTVQESRRVLTKESRVREAAKRGRAFLAGLLDPSMDLLPEYRGSKTYWLYHDNYLAAKVLQKSHPEVARKIANAIQCFGVKESGKIEIVFGEASRPLPFRHFQLGQVKQIGGKVVKTEVVTDKEMSGWKEYADLLFLAALAETEPVKARQHFLRGMAMWDGKGFNDRAVQTNRIYATYKLALTLVAATRLGQHPEAQPAILDRLLAQQAQDGGWITDYDKSGKPVGVANVETTSLAILAVEAANTAKQPEVHTRTTIYPTALGNLGVTLAADRPEIMLGEPVYLSFLVQNHTTTDLQTVQGGDYRNQFGRPESYSVTVVDANGQRLPLVDAGPTMGIMGPQKIPAKGTWVRRLFLPHWAKLTVVGDYTITCKTVLRLGRQAPRRWDHREKTTDVAVEVATHLKVMPLDKKKMGELIEMMGKAMLGTEAASAEATRSLAIIEDERVIPLFNKALDTDNYELQFAALDALAKFHNDEALRGLKKGMTTQASDLIAHCTTEEVARQSAANIRHAATVAFSKSPHPEAKRLLLSMSNDPYSGVRITVLHALGKMDTPESLALLTKMSQDSDKMVRDEALRYFGLRSKKP